jgi:hypothetical protein
VPISYFEAHLSIFEAFLEHLFKHISSIFGAFYGAPTKLYVPVSYLEAHLEHFWSIFGAHLKHISSIFGAFLEHIMEHRQSYMCLYHILKHISSIFAAT